MGCDKDWLESAKRKVALKRDQHWSLAHYSFIVILKITPPYTIIALRRTMKGQKVGSGSISEKSPLYPQIARTFLPLVSLWNYLTHKNLQPPCLGATLTFWDSLHSAYGESISLNKLAFPLLLNSFMQEAKNTLLVVCHKDSCWPQDMPSPFLATAGATKTDHTYTIWSAISELGIYPTKMHTWIPKYRVSSPTAALLTELRIRRHSKDNQR